MLVSNPCDVVACGHTHTDSHTQIHTHCPPHSDPHSVITDAGDEKQVRGVNISLEQIQKQDRNSVSTRVNKDKRQLMLKQGTERRTRHIGVR